MYLLSVPCAVEKDGTVDGQIWLEPKIRFAKKIYLNIRYCSYAHTRNHNEGIQ
jgi:hypothetical protein